MMEDASPITTAITHPATELMTEMASWGGIVGAWLAEEQQRPRLTARTPHKKPRGGELTAAQRAFNRHLGAIRIRVEHCLGWLKHWAVLATRFRCAHDRYTPIMCVLCGLVNAQTARWQADRAYSA